MLYSHQEATLDLLEQMEVADLSDTPLRILLRSWCENVDTFQGFWNNRISTLALSNVLSSSRTSLQGIVVRGDLIVEPNQGLYPPKDLQVLSYEGFNLTI